MDFQEVRHKVKLKNVTALWAAMLLIVFSGCLDIPSNPETVRELEYLRVYSVQSGISDSTLLKIHPSQSATLLADAYPHQYKNELSFLWLLDSNELGHGETFKIENSDSTSHIPNKLKACDSYENCLIYDFEIVVNTPPRMSSNSTPAQGDTLYGNEKTAFYFQWASSDKDAARGDTVLHTLVIDEKIYPVGELTHIYQAGFKPGLHLFYVIATDSRGDSDTLKAVNFTVIDLKGAP